MSWFVNRVHDDPLFHFLVVASILMASYWFFTALLEPLPADADNVLLCIILALAQVSLTRLERLEKRVQT